VKAWHQALETFAAFPDARVALGRVAILQGDPRAAKRHAKAALGIHHRNLHANILMGEVYRREGNFEKAAYWLQKAVDVEPHDLALEGLAMAYVGLYRESFNEDRKAHYSQEARRYVDGWAGVLKPDEAYPRLVQARVYYMVDRREEAARKLEAMLEELPSLTDHQRQVCLERLFTIKAESGDLAGATDALRRVLKIKSLTPEQREGYEKYLNGINENGLKAFLQWEVEKKIEVMSNRGNSADVRRDAMRQLHKLLSEPKYRDDPALAEVVDEAWRACVRTLRPPTPPELAIDMMQFMRQWLKDPRILRIVVHFVGPQDVDSRVTPQVRVEATRTLAEIGGKAAVPSLLFTLRDDARDVTRAIDVALCKLLERRSMIEPGPDAVTPEEQKKLRLGWDEWKHSKSGAAALKESLEELREMTAKDQRFNRKQQKNPLANHVIVEVLLDDDVAFEAWEAGYLFLKEFLGRDYLPPELRGKVVTPALRPVVKEEIRKWYFGDTMTQEEADRRKEEAVGNGNPEENEDE